MQYKGTLYIVSTPIGNLQDFTPRAIETLQQVDLILCEDTRHSSPLFQQFAIKKPLMAFHDHNEKQTAAKIITMLLEGQNIALVSDAGTPLISDPGYYLTSLCHEQNIKVSPVPGASALIAALSASGLPSDTFTFYGFLPAKSKQRKEKIKQIKDSSATSIFYESTHRIIESITDLIEVLGNERVVCIARELTKQFETIKTAQAQQILAYLQENHDHTRGEFVVIVAPNELQEQASFTPEIAELLHELAFSLPPKELAKSIAQAFKLNKTEVYNYLINYKNLHE
ncbi:16S rRNA (cytidine(1402)-2'-O)-methyltransferase [Psittacicella hinzii]|uniref:Ribosomal RNA small subunit methyltransferase I n=1 Tax=Psittacicella hinzii TaxID=2028575 RepID=A0A3A1YBG3_9GAMM|nr:16S rRNA (cytidine(1402)-2'-O)-methyltransferase [Psittacicella hinzii]RIY34706.1 16S rRNA (cytidine(1402)-2'-O)-methyltransferase [Psittacicella hinzii]